MTPEEILHAFNQEQRIRLSEDRPELREVTPQVVRFYEPDFKHGTIMYSWLDETTVEAAIQEQIAYFTAKGCQELEWKVFDYDQPLDLRDRLARHGFEIQEEEALLILEIASAPAALFQPSNLDIRHITDPALVPTHVMGLQSEVWNEDLSELGLYLQQELVNYPDEFVIYVAYVADKPVCSAWMRLPKNTQFASLWGGSTLSEYRKQGFYSAILGKRVQVAQQRGYKFLYIDASPMSRPILEKHGFRYYGYSNPCMWRP